MQYLLNDEIKTRLLKFKDEKYAEFMKKIIPNLKKEVLGVRSPILKKYAKALVRENRYGEFLKTQPHEFFCEDNLNSFILNELRDYDEYIKYLYEFLPHIDNWATCDYIKPRCIDKQKSNYLKILDKLFLSPHEYIKRFAIVQYMRFFIEADYKREIFEKMAEEKSEHYYIKMAIAWAITTLYGHDEDEGKMIFEKIRDDEVRKMTIRKLKDSKQIKMETN